MDTKRVPERAYDEAFRIMTEDATPDIAAAYALLHDAHDGGDRRATYAIATWYLFGKAPVVARDYKAAFELLRLAAEANIPDALYDLGVSYERGAGTEASERSAFLCFLRAAVLGDSKGAYAVSRCYMHAFGTAKDQDTSDIWYDRARSLGYEPDDRDSDA